MATLGQSVPEPSSNHDRANKTPERIQQALERVKPKVDAADYELLKRLLA